MIPRAQPLVILEPKGIPTRTYKIEKGRIGGMVDGIEAMRQAIARILNTTRFEHVIYSGDYGNELGSLIGRNSDLLESETKRLIREALTADDRILDVDRFHFESTGRGDLIVRFTVNTIFGAIEANKEI